MSHTKRARLHAAMVVFAMSTLGLACDAPIMEARFAVSGTISGAVSAGVTVHLGGAAVASTMTYAGGHYTFPGLADGSYTVTPTSAGHTFTPTSWPVSLSGADVAGRDFVAATIVPPTHAISGTISGARFAGVAMLLRGATSDITSPTSFTYTDIGGHYTFTGLADGTYVLKPFVPGYSFLPSNDSVTVAGADVFGRDFTAAAVSGISVFGSVDGVAAEGVDIGLTGAATRSTSTDVFGDFRFDDVPDGAYTVTASAFPWSFVPALYDLATHGANVNLHFLSTPPSSPFTVAIAGDAASGVVAGTYSGNNNSNPNPDVLVYDPANDVWSFLAYFDADDLLNLGGTVSFQGTPLAATYTEETPGLYNRFGGCWAAATVPGGNYDQSWVANSFVLRLDSVGTGVPTNVHGASAHSTLTYYPVHGSFHAVCTPTPNSVARGTVTLDVLF